MLYLTFGVLFVRIARMEADTDRSVYNVVSFLLVGIGFLGAAVWQWIGGW